MARYRKSTYGQSGARTGAGNTPRPYNSPIQTPAPNPIYKPPVVDDTAYVPSIPGTQVLSYNPVDVDLRTKRIRIVDETARDIAKDYKVAGYSDDEVLDILSEFDYLSSGEFEQKFSQDAAAMQEMYEEIFTGFTSQEEAEAWFVTNAYKGSDGEWKLKSTAAVPLRYRDAFRRYYLRGVLLSEYETRSEKKTQAYLDSFADYNEEDPGYVNSIRDVLWNVGNGRGSLWDNIKEWGSNSYGKAMSSGNAAALGLNFAMAAIEDVDALSRLFKSTGKSILPIFNTPPAEYFNFRNPDSKDYFQSTLDERAQTALLSDKEIQGYLEYKFEGDVRPNTDDMKYRMWLENLKDTNPQRYENLMQYEEEARTHLEAQTEEERLQEALHSNEAIDFTTGNWVKDLALEMTHDPTFLIGAVAGTIKSTIKSGAKKVAKNIMFEGMEVSAEVAESIMTSKDLNKQLNRMLRDALPGSEFQKALRQEMKSKPFTNLFSMSDDSINKVATNFADGLDEKTVIDIMRLDEVSEETVKTARTQLANKATAALQSFRTEKSFQVYKTTRQAQYISDAMDIAMLAPVAAVPWALYKIHKLEKSHRLAQKVAKDDLDEKYGRAHKKNGRVIQMSYGVHEYDNVVTYMKNQEFGLYDTLSPELWDAISEGFGNDLKNFRNSVNDIISKNEVDLVSAAKEGEAPTTLHIETVTIEEKLEALNKLTEFHTEGKYTKYSDYDVHIQELLEAGLSKDAVRAYTLDRGLSNTLTPVYQSIKHMVEKAKAKQVAIAATEEVVVQANEVSNLITPIANAYSGLQQDKKLIQHKIETIKAKRAKQELQKTGIPELDKFKAELNKTAESVIALKKSKSLSADAIGDVQTALKKATQAKNTQEMERLQFQWFALERSYKRISDRLEARQRYHNSLKVRDTLWAKGMKEQFMQGLQDIYKNTLEGQALAKAILDGRDLDEYPKGFVKQLQAYYNYDRLLKEAAKLPSSSDSLVAKLTAELQAIDDALVVMPEARKKLLKIAKKTRSAELRETILTWQQDGWKLNEKDLENPRHIHEKYLKEQVLASAGSLSVDPGPKLHSALFNSLVAQVGHAAKRYQLVEAKRAIKRIPMSNHIDLAGLIRIIKDTELDHSVRSLENDIDDLRYAQEQLTKDISQAALEYAHNAHRDISAHLQSLRAQILDSSDLRAKTVGRPADSVLLSRAKAYDTREPLVSETQFVGEHPGLPPIKAAWVRAAEDDVAEASAELSDAIRRYKEAKKDGHKDLMAQAAKDESRLLERLQTVKNFADDVRAWEDDVFDGAIKITKTYEGEGDIIHKLDELIEQLDRGVNEFVRLESQIDINPNSRLIRLKMHNTAILFELLSNPQMHKFVQDVLNGDAPEFAELRRLATGRRHFLDKEGITDDVYQFVEHLTYEQYNSILKTFDSDQLTNVLDDNFGWSILFNTNDINVVKATIKILWEDIHKSEQAVGAYEIYEICERINTFGLTVDRINASNLSDLAKTSVIDKLLSYYQSYASKLRDPNGEGAANFINEVKQSMYSQAANKRSSLGGFVVEILDYEASKEFWERMPAASEGAKPAKSSKAMANERGRALYEQYAPKIKELKDNAHKDPSADLKIQELFIRIRTPEVAARYDADARTGANYHQLSDWETNGTNFDGPSQMLQYAVREWKDMKDGAYSDSKEMLDTFFDTKREAEVRQDLVKVNYHDRVLEADAEILALNYGHEPDVLKRQKMFADAYMNPNEPQFTEEDMLRKYMVDVIGLGKEGEWNRGVVYHNNNNFDAVALIKRLQNVRVIGERMRWDKDTKSYMLKPVEIPLYEDLYGIMEDGHGWPFKKLYDAVFKNGLENSLELSKPLEAQLPPEQEELVKAIVADLASKLPGRMTVFTPVRLRRAIKDYQRILNTDLANKPGKVVYETNTPITSDDLFAARGTDSWLDPVSEGTTDEMLVGDQMNQIMNLMETMREQNDVLRGEYIEDPFYQIASDADILDKFRALHSASPERITMFEEALKAADQDAVDYYTHFVLKDSLEKAIKQQNPGYTPAQVERLAEEQIGPFNNLYRPLTGNNIAAQYTFQTVFDSKILQKYFDFANLRKMTARQIFAAKEMYRKFEYYKSRYKGDITLMHPYRAEISRAIDILKPEVEEIVLEVNRLDEPAALYAYLRKPPETDTITSTIMAQTLMQLVGQPAVELLLQHISPEAVKILTETGMASKYDPWAKPLELAMETDFTFAKFLNEMRKPFNSLSQIAGFFNRDGNYFTDHIRFGAALAKMEAVLTLLKNAGPETRAKFMKIDQEVLAIKAEHQTNQILQKIVGADEWDEALMQHLVWNAGVMVLPVKYSNVYYKGLLTLIRKKQGLTKFVLIENWNGYNVIALKRGTVFHATRDKGDNPKHFYSSIAAGTESEIKAGLAKEYTPPEYAAIAPRDVNKAKITQKYSAISPKITVYMDDMEKRLDVLTNGKSRGSINEALTKKNLVALYDQFELPILDQIIDLNVILEDTYFGNTRFNMSFLGPYKTRYRTFKGAPQVSFVNDYYSLRRAVSYAESKIKYVGFWFDLSQGLGIADLIPIPKNLAYIGVRAEHPHGDNERFVTDVEYSRGVFRYDTTEVDKITGEGARLMTYRTDEQFQPVLDYLNMHKDFSLVSIIPSNVNGSGFELVKQEPVNLADVRRIYEADEDPQWKNIRTVMVPTTVYEQAFSAINRDTFSGPVMQALAWLTHATKVGQLVAMGATVRNLGDGALRVMLSEPEESFAASFSNHFLNSITELIEYNKVVRELSKEYAGKGMNIYHLPMMLKGLPDRPGRMTSEQFLMMVGMQGAMGTESDLLKAVVQPHNDMNSLRRALVDEQGRNIIGPSRDISTLPYEEIEKLYDANLKEINALGLDLSREDFLYIIEDKKYMHEDMPISQRKSYASTVAIMANLKKFEHLEPDDFIQRTYRIEKQYEMIREVLTRSHIKSNITPMEKFKNTYGRGASIALSPMSSVEHILRATQYKIMEEAGYTPTQVLSSISKAQFNYNLKSNAMQRAELMVPFAFFEKNNLEYWARQMVENPAVMRELIQAQGEMAWDFDNYDVQDIAFNYSLQSRMLSGGIPLNPMGLVFKLNPSMFSAMQWMYNPARALLDKTQIPIRQVFLDNMQEYGGLVNALFDESLTWSANPENAIKNGIGGFFKSIFTPNGIPIIGPALMRLTQMLPTYMQRYYQQGGFENDTIGAAASLPLLMVTMFGVQLQKPGYVEFSSYEEYSDYLERQGYAYDNNLNKLVPIDKVSPGGLNDFPGFLPKTKENKLENRLRFEELKRLQYSEGKVWDANINKFVFLNELSLGGLNKTYQDEEGNWLPGGWDQLVADKWTYNHKVWDANQRNFVDLTEKIDGGLNLPGLGWEEYCYYTEKYFGEIWDGNTGKFVTPDLYSGQWGLNRNDLTWDEVQQFKAALFNEEWDSNLHQWVPLGTSTGNQTSWKNNRTGYFGGYFSTRQIIAGAMPSASRAVYKAGTKKPFTPTNHYGRPQLSPILSARDAVIGLTSRDLHNMIKFDYMGYADYARGNTPRQRLQNMRSTWSLYR